MSSSGDQLVSFFLYSLLIYPVTNYLVSPHRSYPRWKGAIYAIGFLFCASTLHMMYENAELGLNHYQLLEVPRVSSLTTIKKAYRSLSLELHPDKNKADDAADQFRKVSKAFDTLSDKDKRREYNRLGDEGVKTLAQQVIDHKYILIQVVVYYCSSAIFAFLMTFSEPSGAAFSFTIFGLGVMLLVELLLVLQEYELPGWFLPYYTSYDIISTLHRLFPAYMNSCRVLTGAFHVDRKAIHELLLDEVVNQSKDITMRVAHVARIMSHRVELLCEEPLDAVEEEVEDVQDDDNSISKTRTPSKSPYGSKRSSGNFGAAGLMHHTLKVIARRVATQQESRDGSLARTVEKKVALLSNPNALRGKSEGSASGQISGWIILRNLTVYLLARFIFIKSGK